MTLSTTETLLLSWLKGPVHGRLHRITEMCQDRVPHREIRREACELDELVSGMTDAMREETP